MNKYDVLQIFLTFFILIIAAPFLGKWMFKILENKPHYLKKPFGFLEKIISKTIGEAHHADELENLSPSLQLPARYQFCISRCSDFNLFRKPFDEFICF